jgi:hypothetical protein
MVLFCGLHWQGFGDEWKSGGDQSRLRGRAGAVDHVNGAHRQEVQPRARARALSLSLSLARALSLSLTFSHSLWNVYRTCMFCAHMCVRVLLFWCECST